MIKGHGIVTVGATIDEACMGALYMERTAKIMAIARLHGYQGRLPESIETQTASRKKLFRRPRDEMFHSADWNYYAEKVKKGEALDARLDMSNCARFIVRRQTEPKSRAWLLDSPRPSKRKKETRLVCQQMFCSLCYFCWCFSSAQSFAQDTYLVAYAGFAGFQAPVWAPKDLGLFDKYGFKGELVLVPGSVRQIQALPAAAFTSPRSMPRRR